MHIITTKLSDTRTYRGHVDIPGRLQRLPVLITYTGVSTAVLVLVYYTEHIY